MKTPLPTDEAALPPVPGSLSLAAYTTDELRREIRRREQPKNEKPFKPCDECRHYAAYEGHGEAPDSYNPCQRGHKMSFRPPSEHYDHWESWGFYRQPCADRRKKENAQEHSTPSKS